MPMKEMSDPATLLHTTTNRMFIAAIAKTLVQRQIISGPDLASELSRMLDDIKRNSGDPQIIAEIESIVSIVALWKPYLPPDTSAENG